MGNHYSIMANLDPIIANPDPIMANLDPIIANHDPNLIICLQGDDIFLDMFEAEYRQMKVGLVAFCYRNIKMLRFLEKKFPVTAAIYMYSTFILLGETIECGTRNDGCVFAPSSHCYSPHWYRVF